MRSARFSRLGVSFAAALLVASCLGERPAPGGTGARAASSSAGRDADSSQPGSMRVSDGRASVEATRAAGGGGAVARRESAPSKPARVVWHRGLHKDRVILKFVDEFPVRLRDGRLAARGVDLAPVEEILRRYPDAKLTRLHTADERVLDQQRASGERKSGKRLADLNNFYLLLFPAPTERAVALANALLALDLVETAYLEAEAGLPGSGSGTPGPPKQDELSLFVPGSSPPCHAPVAEPGTPGHPLAHPHPFGEPSV